MIFGGTNTSESLTTTRLVTKTMNGQNPTPDLQSQHPDLQSQSQPPHQNPDIEIEIQKHAHAFLQIEDDLDSNEVS